MRENHIHRGIRRAGDLAAIETDGIGRNADPIRIPVARLHEVRGHQCVGITHIDQADLLERVANLQANTRPLANHGIQRNRRCELNRDMNPLAKLVCVSHTPRGWN